MTIKKRNQNIDFNSEQKQYYYKSLINKKSMRFAKCVCGFKILLIPDIKAMDRAIRNHVAEHKKSNVNLKEFEPDKLADFLTEQVLIAASE